MGPRRLWLEGTACGRAAPLARPAHFEPARASLLRLEFPRKNTLPRQSLGQSLTVAYVTLLLQRRACVLSDELVPVRAAALRV